MSVEIKEVLTKGQLKKWVDFPNKLYKKVPAYVPFLMTDELSTFNKKENLAYEFCETRLFLAYKEGKIVGMGKHKELLKTCDVYREIASSQLGEEEINNG